MADDKGVCADPSVVAKSLEIARERWVDLQDAISGSKSTPFVMDDEGTSGEGTNELSLPDSTATGRW